MSLPLAIFDLDFTLVNADCEMVWADTLIRLGIVDGDFKRRIDQFEKDYRAGHLDYPAFDECLLSPVKQLPTEKIEKILGKFLEEVRPHIRPWMMQRVKEHQKQGCDVLLATACNSFLAERLAVMLNFRNFICTPVEMTDGKPTGRIIGKAAFCEGKVERLQTWLDRHGYSFTGSWGYSDSHTDIAFLSTVDHPVAVTPDRLLMQHAQEKGWQILNDPEGKCKASLG